MENKKLEKNTVGAGANWNRVLNEKPYDAELHGKEGLYPRSITKRKTILFGEAISKMELGKDIAVKGKSE